MVDRDGRGDGEDEQGFLKRWSRRKLEEAERRAATETPVADAPPAEVPSTEVAQATPEAGAPAETENAEATGVEPEAPGAEPEAPGAEAEAPFDPADLPDIDSLDKDSDYTGFLKDGVPAQLRHMALQKLFRSDPALAVLDGLNDYDEDFTLAKVAEKIVSSYKPGRGYVDDEDETGDIEERDIIEDGDVETGDVETGDVETGDVETGDVETGDVEDEEGETGDAENTELADADETDKRGHDT